MAWSEDMRGIGLERNGELMAAVLYEGWSGPNVWMHCAKAPGVALTSRVFFPAVFMYPFDQLHVRRISAHIEEVNMPVNRLVHKLGFRPEARLVGAARDGGDVIIYRMWRNECRFVAPRST